MSFRSLSIAAGALALCAAPFTSSHAQLVFAPAMETSLSGFPRGPLSADLNGDGFADLVLQQGEIQRLLGAGDGTFGAPAPAVPGGFPFLFPRALADFTGDGLPDLISDFSGTLNLHPGLGDGSFGDLAPGGPANVGLGVATAHAVQVDADAARELLVFSTGDPGFEIGGNARVWDYSAVGTPALLFAFERDGAFIAGAVSDVDADGAADVVLAERFFGPPPRVTELLLFRAGADGFERAESLGLFTGLAALALDDLDGDDALDVLLVDAEGLALHRGSGDGALGAREPLTLPAGTSSTQVLGLHLAALDDDTAPDLLLARSLEAVTFPEPTFLALRNLGDGGFGAAVPLTLPSGTSHDGADFTFTDLELDGRVEPVLVADVDGGGGRLVVFPNATYPAGAPAFDLGAGVLGSAGPPVQLLDGSYVGGTPYLTRLVQGAPAASAWAVLGFAPLGLSFKGGTMVPSVDRLVGPFSLDGEGAREFAGTWPDGVPTGFELYQQFWIADAFGPAGFAASSGARITAP